MKNICQNDVILKDFEIASKDFVNLSIRSTVYKTNIQSSKLTGFFEKNFMQNSARIASVEYAENL